MDDWRIETKVAGVTFEGRQEVLASVREGDWLRVLPEPTNEYDPNAAGVWRVDERGRVLPGQQCGYIPRTEAAVLRHSFAQDYEVWAHVAAVVGGGEKSIGLRLNLKRRLSVAEQKGR
jgi:single-stranded-DNA-specific exonuclease